MQNKKNVNNHNRIQQDYFGARIKATMIPGNAPYIRKQIQTLISFSGLLPGSRVLEVGAGMGRHAIPLYEMGYKVEGLELSPFLIEQFHHYNSNDYNIPFYQADILSPPPEIVNGFDGVIGFFVLHHLFDLEESFRVMAEVLKPGGLVVFIEPNPWNLLYFLQILFTPGMRWKAEKNILQMQPKKIVSSLENAGLTGFKMMRFGFFPRFIANTSMGGKLDNYLEKIKLIHPFLPFQVFYALKPD